VYDKEAYPYRGTGKRAPKGFGPLRLSLTGLADRCRVNLSGDEALPSYAVLKEELLMTILSEKVGL
jgi:hypothetical protein